MIYTRQPYPLRFIQLERCPDKTPHLFTYIYKFRSPITKYWYVLRADYHEENVFAVKFYAQRHKHSDHKYSKLTNKGDVIGILITCLSVIPLLLQEQPGASFGFIGSRTIDRASKRVEGYSKTQRFRVYRRIVNETIGPATFEHFEYETISGYLLVNKSVGDIELKERVLIKMFSETYENLLDV